MGQDGSEVHMEDNPCRYCRAPKRYPGCQDHCAEGVAWKKKHDAQRAEERTQRAARNGVYNQRSQAVAKAYRKQRK